MNVLVLLAHPNPASFNHALAATTRETLAALGHEVVFHDLCAEEFPPALPGPELHRRGPVPPVIRAHCRELVEADGIVIVHPNWWGQPPAVLKGWIDRVVRPDVAYRFEDTEGGEGVPVGLLKTRAAVILNTSNTGASREHDVFGDPLEAIWRHCIFGLCGVENVVRKVFRIVITSTDDERQRWLETTAEIVRATFPEDRNS